MALTTHILDVANGKPGNGIEIDLYLWKGEQRVLLKSVVTNQDGRVDQPLLMTEELEAGHYEFCFYTGAYFRQSQSDQQAPPFLETIPVRFYIHNTAEHYHIPLIISPWSYQVYRGS
ncbi:hydroxyisourate hydrolase [Gracilibacillus salinarum]|uniref:5-hydroxyisourate hydrolase n=1 Tax=Gracilibacillus salinarum TaxID=2932255 RepID=A0ABY4GGH0_9BACI|nr:hydroxyisourate hydrolase [Gracilibacillus salinarum]UOQ83352.1 hydroxyisourate hydrolase [Gracilibacillus salinarum]